MAPWLYWKYQTEDLTVVQEILHNYKIVSLVRSQLEYACIAWDPYQIKYISNLENVQRKATRFVKQDFLKYNSVTRMIRELGWKNLQDRRNNMINYAIQIIINEIASVPNRHINTCRY